MRRRRCRAYKSNTPKYIQPVADLYIRLYIKPVIAKLPEELTGKLVK